MYSFDTLKKELEAVNKWLVGELANVRTGSASTAILDGITVDAYGIMTPLNQVANIGIEDAKTIRISPWDKSQSGAIEKAIVVANLGVSVIGDAEGVRVVFPEMTTERRGEMAKLADKKLEDARIRMRQVREDVWSDIQTQEREGDLTEDDKFRAKEDLQKIVDETNGQLESLAKKKRDDLMK